MKKYLLPVLFMASLPLSASAQVNRTQRGSVLGGVLGAAAGVAIGEHNDEPLAGALIGGAVGALAGAKIGNNRDQQVARQQAYQYQQRQQVIRRAVTPRDVVSMTHSGLSESVIINHIQLHGVLNEIQVSDIVSMHQNGVSDRVISTMQRARLTTPNAVAPARVVVPAPAPVSVRTYPAPPVVIQHYPTPQYQIRYTPQPTRHHHPSHRSHSHRRYRR